MRKVPDPRTVYMYLVCFLALIALVTGVVRAGGAAIDLMVGTSDSDVQFIRTPPRIMGEQGQNLPEQVVQAQIDFDARQRADAGTHVQSDLIRALAVFLVAGPVYAYHWRLLKREERSGRPPSHWGPRPVYYLLVSLAALIMVFSATGNLLDNLAGVARPRNAYSVGPVDAYLSMAEVDRDPAAAIAKSEQEHERALEHRRKFHLVSSARSGLLLAVGVGLYAVHWPVARRGFDQ